MSDNQLYCHDTRHDTPCPLPCIACMEDCDGPFTHDVDYGVETASEDEEGR